MDVARHLARHGGRVVRGAGLRSFWLERAQGSDGLRTAALRLCRRADGGSQFLPHLPPPRDAVRRHCAGHRRQRGDPDGADRLRAQAFSRPRRRTLHGSPHLHPRARLPAGRPAPRLAPDRSPRLGRIRHRLSLQHDQHGAAHPVFAAPAQTSRKSRGAEMAGGEGGRNPGPGGAPVPGHQPQL